MSKVRAFCILSIVILFALLGQSCRRGTTVKTPKVEKGTIDLTGWDFNRDGNVKLNGDWEFYWDTFLMDSTLNSKNIARTGYLFVPGLWNNKKINEISFPSHGFASYRLKIKLNTTEELSIKYLNSATSCEIFVDGVSLHRAGKPGKSNKEIQPGYQPAIIPFTPQGDTVEVVLQIANFHHKKAGQWEPLLLGNRKQISQLSDRLIFIELISIGGLLIMALFHLMIFVKHRYEKPLFYFGIFVFLITTKFIVSGQFTIYLFHEFRWINLVKADYLSFYLAILFFLFFIRSLYPNEIHQWVTKTITAVCLVFSSSVLVLPINYFSYGVVYFQVFTVLGGLYAFFILHRAIKNKREGATFFLYGFMLLFVCMVHDILNENEVIYSISLVLVGFPFFILFQALILSSKIRKALISNEKLSVELTQQNEEYVQLNKRYKVQNEQLIVAKEKAEESDRFKSAFLANISHEIRTPMNGILGFTELLSREELSEEKRTRYLTILKERGHHLLGVINDIIDISRIETGHIDLRTEATNVNELINELFDFYYQTAENKKLKFIKKVTLPNYQSFILVDKQKLRQILDNLLSNSFKFTKTGEIELGYQVSENSIYFYVRDTGIGLSDSEIEIIFDRFNQANKNISHQYGGTGLGLSIVKAYVEKLGGQIGVTSKPAVGSVFHFTIPYQRNIQMKGDDATEQEHDNPHLKENLTILLVEDNMTNAFLIEEILQPIKAYFIHAKNGNEAVDHFRLNPQIDLVLMDIKLPDTNGYDLTRLLKTIRKNVPVIAQTAYALLGDKEKAIEAGCIDYLSKPIDSEELIAKIYKYTSNARNKQM